MKQARKAVIPFLVALVAGLVFAAPVSATFPGKNGRIAFSDSPEQTVFTVAPDGGGITRLTDPLAISSAWSADGARVAVSGASASTTGFDIFVVNAEGGEKVPVTDNQFTFNLDPTWSPDGRTIAFSQTDGCPSTTCGVASLALLEADGTGERTICCGRSVARDPTWSPDGTLIAFMRAVDASAGPLELWTVRPDGADATRVCCDGRNAAGPDWSPDARRILFRSRNTVMAVQPDGSGLEALYTPPSDVRILHAEWSPDGAQIVVSQDQGAGTTAGLHVVQADGSNIAEPVPNTQDAFEPSWQPIPGPRRGDYRNAPGFCRAEREFWGVSSFGVRYGENGNAANAFGRCVSANS